MDGAPFPSTFPNRKAETLSRRLRHRLIRRLARRDVVVLAEVRALFLTHPNPFPEIELFRFPDPRRWARFRKSPR